MEDRFLFNEPGNATKTADKHANAFVTNFFSDANSGSANRVQAIQSQGHVCDNCNKPFAGAEMFGFQNKRYHKECFILDKPCDECGKRIFREPFVSADGKVFLHESCAKKERKLETTSLVAPMSKMTIDTRHKDEEERQRLASKINEGKVACAICFKVISGLSVSFQGKTYHDLCLVCTKCQSPLTDKVFRIDEQNRALCTNCDLGGGKCVGCLKLLGAGVFVTAGKHKWHAECFNVSRNVIKNSVLKEESQCSRCKKNLRGKPYAEVNSSIRCADCVNAK